ncbi:20195_t:CDS:2, partial [Racocetra persica]
IPCAITDCPNYSYGKFCADHRALMSLGDKQREREEEKITERDIQHRGVISQRLLKNFMLINLLKE